MPLQVLVVEDNPGDIALLERMFLSSAQANSVRTSVTPCPTLASALHTLTSERFDVVLIDLGLPDSQGISTFCEVHNACPQLPTIVLTGAEQKSLGLQAVRSGAQDYLIKGGFDADALLRSIRYAMARQEVINEVQILTNAIDITTVGVVVTAAEGDQPIIYANRHFYGMTGYDESEVIGRNCRFLQGADTDQATARNIGEAVRRGQHVAAELLNYRKNGTSFWNEIRIDPVLDERGKLIRFVGMQQDVSDRRRLQEQTRFLAYHDKLTGLPNSDQFDQYLRQATAARADKANLPDPTADGASIAVLYLDIDRFSVMNETIGHAASDALLQAFATRLQQFAADRQLRLARMAGDEFALLVAPADEALAEQVAADVVRLVRAPFLLDGERFFLTVSVSASASVTSTAEQLLRDAFHGLRDLKAAGGDASILFSPRANVDTYKAFVLIRDIHTALEQGQLEVYYQPRVNPFGNEIVGAEALLRWRHPDWGMIRPDEFIALLEQRGIMVEVGQWVVDTVCAQMAAWTTSGLTSIPVSVNFSPRQFLQPDLCQRLLATLSRYGLAPGRLEIELTERLVMLQESVVKETMRQLDSAGVQVAIDDFGTGHSSLLYLRNFPVHILKIDKVFVSGMIENNAARLITASVVSLGRQLGLRVVGEGVETVEQLTLLRQWKCDEVQGFLYSKPVPAATMTTLLRRGHISLDKEGPHVDRRRYFRVQLPCPLIARVTISQVGNQSVNVGWSDVLLPNIGPGGLCVVTPLRLPLQSNVTLQFETTIFEHLALLGRVVWTAEVMYGLFQYGVEFIIEEAARESLIGRLNRLAARLRQQAMVAGCTTYDGKPAQFFGISTNTASGRSLS